MKQENISLFSFLSSLSEGIWGTNLKTYHKEWRTLATITGRNGLFKLSFLDFQLNLFQWNLVRKGRPLPVREWDGLRWMLRDSEMWMFWLCPAVNQDREAQQGQDQGAQVQHRRVLHDRHGQFVRDCSRESRNLALLREGENKHGCYRSRRCNPPEIT